MFNPQARWDRRQPGSQSECLNEPIAVLAAFEGAKIVPRLFSRHNKIYKIRKVTYFWQERRGSELLSRFSVETPAGLYQISFSNQSLSWRLNAIL